MKRLKLGKSLNKKIYPFYYPGNLPHSNLSEAQKVKMLIRDDYTYVMFRDIDGELKLIYKKTNIIK